MDLLIVGLDGLSYNMLDRFDVEFDYLEGVRERSVSGDLMSVDTPTTIPAWTSFATGKDPGSHGVHGMKRVSADYEHGPAEVNTTDAAMYDLLEDAVFINLPASANRVPAAEDTYVQPSILAESKAKTTPAPLRELDSYDDYVPLHDPAKKKNPDAYLEHVLEIVRSRTAFAREAFETYDPRVGFVLFSATDWAGHILSKLTSEADQRQFYRAIVGEVAEGAETLAPLAPNVLLMSDHGFEHKTRTVHLADWLRDEGYLKERSGDPDRGAVERTLDAVADTAVGTAKALSRRSDRLYAAFRFLHNRLLGTDVGARLQSAARPDADYEHSLVWQLRYGCLYVNDDRFSNPQVGPEEADRLREGLVEDLSELTTAEGDPVFRTVMTAEEAYADPVADVPDVVPRPAPGHFPITHWSPTGGYTSPTDNYEHRYRGIIAAEGPLFDTGTVEGMSVVDLLPTLFAALGEPLPPDVDGDVTAALLAEEPTVRWLDEAAVPAPRVRSESDAEREEREEAVEERLADLGYME